MIARSAAYRDFIARLAEPRRLLRLAAPLAAQDALSLAKGAVVLTAAALERYVNDALLQRCQRISGNHFETLSEGEQRYLAFQMARVVLQPSRKLFKKRDTTFKVRKKFRQSLDACTSAIANPSSWSEHPEYGMFMDGSAEPTRLAATLDMFHSGTESLFDFVQGRGKDRGAIAAGLQGLITARHGVAHALQGVPPSPADARRWLALCFILAREIEAYIA